MFFISFSLLLKIIWFPLSPFLSFQKLLDISHFRLSSCFLHHWMTWFTSHFTWCTSSPSPSSSASLYRFLANNIFHSLKWINALAMIILELFCIFNLRKADILWQFLDWEQFKNNNNCRLFLDEVKLSTIPTKNPPSNSLNTFLYIVSLHLFHR